MERWLRNPSPSERYASSPDRLRNSTTAQAYGDGNVLSSKRPSISRAAENLQSRLRASLRRRRSDDGTTGDSPFLLVFFRLPSEIRLAIVSELCMSDLLSLRRTSRALNDLVVACGPALVRFWVKRRLGSLHIQLFPPPGPNEADFHYLLAMRRRHLASVRLTRELSLFVLRDTLKYSDGKQRQLWSSVYENLVPLVFAVGYFLEEHRKVILDRDLGRIRPRYHIGYDICTTPGIMDAERNIFRKLDQPLRLQYFYTFLFIVQTLNRKLRPPTYAGSVEKIVRGWTKRPACDEDVAFVLVLGGISQVAKLLACRNYNERHRLLHTFITRLSPHESVAWRSHWRELGVSSPALLDDIPCTTIGITKLDQIWQPLMAELMRPESKEFTDHQKESYFKVRASRKYINVIMGYDILRGRPAEGWDHEQFEEDNDSE